MSSILMYNKDLEIEKEKENYPEFWNGIEISKRTINLGSPLPFFNIHYSDIPNKNMPYKDQIKQLKDKLDLLDNARNDIYNEDNIIVSTKRKQAIDWYSDKIIDSIKHSIDIDASLISHQIAELKFKKDFIQSSSLVCKMVRYIYGEEEAFNKFKKIKGLK